MYCISEYTNTICARAYKSYNFNISNNVCESNVQNLFEIEIFA